MRRTASSPGRKPHNSLFGALRKSNIFDEGEQVIFQDHSTGSRLRHEASFDFGLEVEDDGHGESALQIVYVEAGWRKL
jgi:hypothetical protein